MMENAFMDEKVKREFNDRWELDFPKSYGFGLITLRLRDKQTNKWTLIGVAGTDWPKANVKSN